jgi:PTS system mannose-specific IIA component
MDASRIGLIVATHGHLAKTLVETTDYILSRPSELKPFAFLEGESPQESSKKLQALIKKCDKGKGVIILVDLFGGTPGSLALSLLEESQVEVVTGVNLPMTLAAANLDPSLSLDAASEAVVKAGKLAIKGAGRLLKG